MRAKAGSKGSYAEDVGTLLGEAEIDAYFLKELPKISWGEGNSLRLVAAREVCVGTKNAFGIGFSLEDETAGAYQMSLFCGAVGMEKFAFLWGLRPEAFLDAPLKGQPPHLISDRGRAPLAAIVKKLVQDYPVKEATETYSGQSKASVEGGHRRERKVDGPPTYVVSDKDVIQLIQREICLAVLDNHRSYVGDLVIGSRAFAETVNSPYALGQLLDKQGLNESISISFDDAVRTYLTKVSYELRDAGFWYETRCYSSEEIETTTLYEELNPGQAIEIRGYHMPLNLMWAWVEFRGKLYQLQQKLPGRMGENEKLVSVKQIQQEVAIKKLLDSEHRRSAVAAEIEARARFEKYTGVSWGKTTRKPGRPKKSTNAAIEKKVLNPKPFRSRTKAA
jgi:hypothetical protein